MLTVALLIAIGAVAHASWNLIVKATHAPSGLRFLWLQAVLGLAVVGPIAVWQLATSPVPLWLPLATGALSFVFHTAYFLSLQRGYRVGDVGVVYPLARGTGPLLSVVLAILLLGERPEWLVLLAAAAIIAGVLVIGFAGGVRGAARAKHGIGWGLATGVAIAAYTIWDAHAVTTLGVPPAAHLLAIGLLQVVLLAYPALRDRAAFATELRSSWRPALAVAILSPISYLVILVAFQLLPSDTAVAIVAPGREVSVVLVGLAGWLWFKEPHPVQRLIGCAFVVGGVVMLAVA